MNLLRNRVVDQPPLTVAMAVHNAMPFLEASVRSILDQTFPDFEFVIGDDGSVDGSSELLHRFAAVDPRIRLLRRERKSGLAASANWVVGEARAPLVAIAHADDLSYPERLRAQMAIFADAPDLVLAGTLFDGIDDRGRIIRPGDYWRLFHGMPFAPFAHSSIMFRHDAFASVGGYRPEAEYWEDLDLYLRLAELGRIAVVPQVLTSVRHARISTRLRDRQTRVEAAVERMYRVAKAYRGGSEWANVAGPQGNERLHPRTFIARGSTNLWAGRRPRVLARLIRRGRLRPDMATLQSLIWALWGDVSPRSLRAFIRALLHARNALVRSRLTGADSIEWQPRADATSEPARSGRFASPSHNPAATEMAAVNRAPQRVRQHPT